MSGPKVPRPPGRRHRRKRNTDGDNENTLPLTPLVPRTSPVTRKLNNDAHSPTEKQTTPQLTANVTISAAKWNEMKKIMFEIMRDIANVSNESIRNNIEFMNQLLLDQESPAIESKLQDLTPNELTNIMNEIEDESKNEKNNSNNEKTFADEIVKPQQHLT